MKKTLFLIVILFSITQFGCDALDPDGNGDPTSFNGRVEFIDGVIPVNAEISIVGSKDGIPDRIIVSDQVKIGEDGTFSLNFEGNKDIDFFDVMIFETIEVDQNPTFDFIECGNLNCSKVLPGKNYDDIVITAKKN